MTERATYWGDLHSHCSISYGQGTVEQALLRARQQLDFCSITGHAFWPDMPTDRTRYGEIIDYHRQGFDTLAGNWDELVAKQREAHVPGEFVVLPSYEWHSLKYGDHNVYGQDPELALRDAPDLPALRAMALESNAIIVPHHIGYQAGYRGIDWDHFDESASPIVEVYSLHGCSVSSQAACPMLHDMGPRDAGSTAVAGWRRGHRFGIIASTDHHGGYPGSHGDGRAAVIAESLQRESLWEAIQARRTYAVTGDKIEARMWLNDAWIGDAVRSRGSRHIQVNVTALDHLDRVELLKNERVVRRWHAGDGIRDDRLHRVRLVWGWGRKDQVANWNIRARWENAELSDVESCFSGQSVVAPKGVSGHQADEDELDLPHELVDRSDRSLSIRSVTMGNRSTRHPTTQSVSMLVDAAPDAKLHVETDAGCWSHGLNELQAGPRTHYQHGWLSPALQIGPAIPLSLCQACGSWTDEASDNGKDDPPQDNYRLRVAQTNGQWAWLTPIWVER